MTTDATLEILRDIRDSIRGTNDRVDATNQRLEQVNGRLEQVNGRLEQVNGRLDEVNGRLEKVEGALLELAEQQRFMVRYMRGLAERDARMDGDLVDLRARVEVLEEKVGKS